MSIEALEAPSNARKLGLVRPDPGGLPSGPKADVMLPPFFADGPPAAAWAGGPI